MVPGQFFLLVPWLHPPTSRAWCRVAGLMLLLVLGLVHLLPAGLNAGRGRVENCRTVIKKRSEFLHHVIVSAHCCFQRKNVRAY